MPGQPNCDVFSPTPLSIVFGFGLTSDLLSTIYLHFHEILLKACSYFILSVPPPNSQLGDYTRICRLYSGLCYRRTVSLCNYRALHYYVHARDRSTHGTPCLSMVQYHYEVGGNLRNHRVWADNCPYFRTDSCEPDQRIDIWS